jgi:chromosome segregation ATPase
MHLPDPRKTQRVAALLLAGGLAAGSVGAYVVLLRWRLDAAERRAAGIQATLAETHNTHGNNIKEKTDEIAKLKAELKTGAELMGKTKAELEARIQALELEVEKYRENTTKLNTEIVQSRESIEALETEIAGLGGREGAPDYQQQIHDLEARIQELITASDEQVRMATENVAKMTEFMADAEKSKLKLKTERDAQVAELKETIQLREKKIDDLRETINQWKIEEAKKPVKLPNKTP